MRALYLQLTTLLLTLSFSAVAQRPAYNLKLTEPDQELDDFTFRFKANHHITPRLRGVRGTGSTLYWVSTDSRWLTAYKAGQQLWQVNVAKAFSALLPAAKIDRLIFTSRFIFVFTTERGHAEVNRLTGEIGALGVDPK